MRDLRFVGVDDEGTRLLLVDEDGQQHQVQIDDALRGAVRVVRTRPSSPEGVDENVRPRDVQAMLRTGLTIDEVAERTGWSPTKVGLFEPPIRAERDHVATTAQRLPLHTRVAGRDQTSTVGDRVGDRLAHRGVDSADITWDAFRSDRGWTIECRFPAGGRPRVATWRYDAATQSLHPTDDEARWLSEDEQQPSAAPFGRTTATAPGVYDVVAEGGLDQSAPAPRTPARQSAPRIPHARVNEPDPAQATGEAEAPAVDDDSAAEQDTKQSGPVDLVSVMRERSKARRRASSRRKPDNSQNHPAGKQTVSSGASSDGSSDAPVDTSSGASKAADDAAPAKPSVDELGHDPVTGTADLFGLKEVEPLRREVREVGATDENDDAENDKADNDTADTAVEQDIEKTADNTAEDSVDDEVDATGSDDPDADDDAREDAEEPEKVRPVRESATGTTVPDRPSQARKGRPSVPSWDDIMFGKRGPKD